MFFRALRVISAFSAFYHLHPSVGIFAHSPNLPLSSSPGSGSTYLYTLYTFYTAKVIQIGLLAWSASGGANHYRLFS